MSETPSDRQTPTAGVRSKLKRDLPCTSNQQDTAASHTYDRAAKKWDSFDVEAALAQLSDDDQEASLHKQRPPSVSSLDQVGRHRLALYH